MNIINEEKINNSEISSESQITSGDGSNAKVAIVKDEPEIVYLDFADFMKVEMRAGKVIEASEPDWSNKLIKQVVDFGSEIGQKVIFSGLRKWYSAADIQDKVLAYVANLAPRKMGEEMSSGMIIAVSSKSGKPILWDLTLADVEPGELIG